MSRGLCRGSRWPWRLSPKGYNLRFPTPDPNKELGPTSWPYYVYFSSFPGGQERIPRHCFWSMSGRLLFQTRLRPWGRTQRAIRVHKPVTFWFPFWTSVAETTMLSDIPPHTHIWRPTNTFEFMHLADITKMYQSFWKRFGNDNVCLRTFWLHIISPSFCLVNRNRVDNLTTTGRRLLLIN